MNDSKLLTILDLAGTLQPIRTTSDISGGTTRVQTVRRTGAHGPRGPIPAPKWSTHYII